MWSWQTRAAAGLGLGVALTACSGASGDPSQGNGSATPGGPNSPGNGAAGSGPGSGDGTAPPVALDEFGPNPGPVPIRRLTNDEYRTTLGDLFPPSLFPDGVMPELDFVPDVRVAGLPNQSSAQTSSPVRMEQYETAAQIVATSVVANPTALTGCDAAAAGESACAEPFLFDLGKRAFRRPLEERERTILTGLLTDTAATDDYPTRLGLAIRYLLLSPSFLFRPEIGVGEPSAAVRGLTSHELAARLSYFLTGSTPDPELTAAADLGTLNAPEAIRAQAVRLLGDERTHANLTAFHRAWLNTALVPGDRDTTLFPTFSPSIALFMAEESRLFFQNVLFAQGGSLRELYTASYTFANDSLAAFYGVPPPATPWARVELDPTQRAGIITQPAWLVTNGHQDEGSAILRGKFVLGTFLCSSVPPPPPGITSSFPARDRSLTQREWLSSQHEASPVCGTCHGILDPLGLPFEHYDGAGLWRPDDRGMPLDVSGSYTANGESITFDGAVEFAQLLPDFTPAKRCYIAQWFRFGMGRLDGVNDPDDIAYLAWLTSNYDSNTPVVELVTRFIESNGFRFIRAASTVGP